MRALLFCVAAFLPLSAAAQDQRPVDAVHCEKEADCLSRLKGLVARKGDVLRLKLENGKTKVLKGDKQACEDGKAERCLVYELRAYRPVLKMYVVDVGTWEGGGAVIVSARTGRSILLDTLPVFSPGGRWFVSVSNTEYGDRHYDVAIWSTASGEPKEEFRYSPPEGSPYEYWEFLSWDGDNRIKLKVSVNLGDGSPMRVIETDAILTAQGWTLNRPQVNR